MGGMGILLNEKFTKFLFLYNFKVLLKSYNFCLKIFFLSFWRYSLRKKNTDFFQKSISLLKHELGHVKNTWVVCRQPWSVKTNPLHVSLWRHGLDGVSQEKGVLWFVEKWRVEIIKRVIKCVLISSPYTCPKIWLALTVPIREVIEEERC